MSTWIPAALLWLGAMRLHRKSGLAPASAHLCVLLGAVLALSLAAMLNVIFYAAAALYAGILVCTVLDVRRQGVRAWGGALRAFLTRPVLLAMAGGAVLGVVFLAQEPAFMYWDEFLIAGTNAKILHLSGLMYRVAESAAMAVEDPCGGPVLSYLYQFFSPAFSEAGLYLSYGYLYFAVFAAAAEQVEARGAGRQAGSLAFLALALTPFFLGYHTFTADYSAISYGYATAQVDYMLAVGMLACVALYLAAPRARWYWLAIAFTCLLKESGVLFTAAVAGVLAMQRLPARGAGRGAWLRWLGAMLTDVALGAACYIAWLAYLSLSGSASPAPGFTAAALLAAVCLAWHCLGETRRAACRAACGRLRAWLAHWAGPVALGAAGLAAALLLSGRFGFFTKRATQAGRILAGFFVPGLRAGAWQQTLDLEVEGFFRERLLYPLPDWLTVLLLTLLVLVACLAQRRRGGGLRLLFTHLLLCVGAVAYLITMAYYVSSYYKNMGMVEYPRYFTSYLFGWAYILFLLVLTLPGAVDGRRLLAMAAAVACAANFACIGPEHTIIAAPQNYRQEVRQTQALAAEADATVQPGERIYLVTARGDTYTPMVLCEHLYPALTDCPRGASSYNYSLVFSARADPKDPDGKKYNFATAEEFAADMQRNFDYILVCDGRAYARDYGALFEGGLEPGRLYRVTQEAQAPFRRVYAGG